MSITPAADMATYLAANSTSSLVQGQNLFIGPLRPPSTNGAIPIKAVFLLETGGASPSRYMGARTEVRYPHVQVMVRSSDYTSGDTLTQSVYNTLHSATVTNYMDIAPIGNPSFVDEDERYFYYFSANFEARYNSTS